MASQSKDVRLVTEARMEAQLADPVFRETIKGDPGDRGPQGERGLQGLPGLDAVPQAEGMAAHIEAEGPVRTALNAAFVPLSGLKVPLDIWPDYEAPGTYAGWISEIDSVLAGRAAKSTIGTASDGSTPIHAYTAGSDAAPHALLVGGVHGNETASAVSNWRWFESFVEAENPVMAALRERLRVTWVPFLNASQYRGGRANSSNPAVDINRNWPMNWDIATVPDPSRAKGPAEMSEPENQALKALIDSTDIAALIDVHTNEVGSPHLWVGGTPFYIHMNHSVTNAAMTIAKQLYAKSGATTTRFRDWGTDWLPTLTNWAPKHIRWNLGRLNASSVLIEIERGMLGSTAASNAIPFVTRAANRIQNGFITTWLIEWLEHGQEDGPRTYRLDYGRLNPPHGTDVETRNGGRLLPYGQGLQPVYFEGGRDYFGINVYGPADYIINYDMEFHNPAGATGDAYVETRIGFGPMTPTGEAGKITAGQAAVRISPGETVTVSRMARVEVTPPWFNDRSTTAYMIQLFARATGDGVSAQLTSGFRAGSVTVTPKLFLDGYPAPSPTR